jgi:hypothetical protein
VLRHEIQETDYLRAWEYSDVLKDFWKVRIMGFKNFQTKMTPLKKLKIKMKPIHRSPTEEPAVT